MPKMSPVNLARYNKLWVAAVTFGGALVANHVITGKTADVVSAAIGAAGVLGVFVVPNAGDTRVVTSEKPSYEANVDWTPVGQGSPHISSYINPEYAKNLEQRAEAVKPLRDKSGKFIKKT